jgi:hypothetical protein
MRRTLSEDHAMANEEQLAILKQGVDVWNQWRKENENILVASNVN